MDNIIVASFKDHASALDGYTRLKLLDDAGEIYLYRIVFFAKGANGEYTVLNGEDNITGAGTLAGMSLGGLIGALAGPVGLAVGAFSGTLTGGLADAESVDVSKDFLNKIFDRMGGGSWAIVAEVAENQYEMVDSLLSERGATVYRTSLDEEYDRYENAQLDELDSEISKVEAEAKDARAENKAEFDAKVADLKAKRAARKKELDTKVADAKNRWSQKRESFKEKVEHAGAEAKEKLKSWAASNF